MEVWKNVNVEKKVAEMEKVRETVVKEDKDKVEKVKNVVEMDIQEVKDKGKVENRAEEKEKGMSRRR